MDNNISAFLAGFCLIFGFIYGYICGTRQTNNWFEPHDDNTLQKMKLD